MHQIKVSEAKAPQLAGRRRELSSRPCVSDTIYADETHLAACMRWLERAQGVNGSGGVSAAFHMDTGQWDVDYPETTGYIIPTFLAYWRLSGKKIYRERAIEMGDWEIAIQAPEGGAGEPVGVLGRPRVFNTGQVVLGWTALYAETGESKYLEAAVRAVRWIIDSMDPDGKWCRNTFKGPKAYKNRVTWAIMELLRFKPDAGYHAGAERSLKWVLSQARTNGWFWNNSLSDPEKPWTHLTGYVLTGLSEIYRLNRTDPKCASLLPLLTNAAKAIADFYLGLKRTAGGRFVTLPATLDSEWRSADEWSCLTGCAQTGFFLRCMHHFTNHEGMKAAADLLIEDLKRLQFLDGGCDENIIGGLPGSYPLGKAYLGYAIPNWGVKFFADTLLQRLLPEKDQMYLG